MHGKRKLLSIGDNILGEGVLLVWQISTLKLAKSANLGRIFFKCLPGFM